MSDSIQKTQKYYGFTKLEVILITILLLVIFIAPWLFTRASFFDFDFEGTGQIGDTIGGITAPFVNLLAAFLVYKSFTAQIKANVDQRNNHNEQIKLIRQEQSLTSINELYDRLEIEISKLKSDVPDRL